MDALPFAPNWRYPLTERLEWLTDVIEAYDATEERTPLRTSPRRVFEYQVMATLQEAALFDALLWRWQAEQYVLPIWTDPQYLGATLGAGAGTITIPTTGYDFSAPGYAVLWNGPQSYEVVTVASMSASSLTLTGTTVSTWGSHTRIYPGRLARLLDAVKVSHHTAAVAEIRLRLEIEPAAVTAGAGSTTYRSLEVFTQAHNWRERREQEFKRKADRFDYDLGAVAVDDISGLPQTKTTHSYQMRSRAEILAFRAWLSARQGRAVGMWIPSRTFDLEQAQSISSGSTTLKVKALSISARYQLQAGRKDIALKYKPTGAWYYRRITAVAAGDPGEENMTIDAALGVTAAAGTLEPISWLSLGRLEADAVDIAWLTPTVAESKIELRGVKE